MTHDQDSCIHVNGRRVVNLRSRLCFKAVHDNRASGVSSCMRKCLHFSRLSALMQVRDPSEDHWLLLECIFINSTEQLSSFSVFFDLFMKLEAGVAFPHRYLHLRKLSQEQSPLKKICTDGRWKRTPMSAQDDGRALWRLTAVRQTKQSSCTAFRD